MCTKTGKSSNETSFITYLGRLQRRQRSNVYIFGTHEVFLWKEDIVLTVDGISSSAAIIAEEAARASIVKRRALERERGRIVDFFGRVRFPRELLRAAWLAYCFQPARYLSFQPPQRRLHD